MTNSTAACNATFALCSTRYNERSLYAQVLDVLTENDVAPPSIEHVDLIGRAADQAQALFFAAAMAEPTCEELRAFFQAFVRSCAGVRTD